MTRLEIAAHLMEGLSVGSTQTHPTETPIPTPPQTQPHPTHPLRMRDGAMGGSPFESPDTQGFVTGLYTDPNGAKHQVGVGVGAGVGGWGLGVGVGVGAGVGVWGLGD